MKAKGITDELALVESERGFRVSARATLNPGLGVPWVSLALFVGAGCVALATVWLAALPFLAMGLALLHPSRGSIVYGLELDLGKLTFVGAKTVPLHVFDRVERDGRQLVFVGEEPAVLEIEASEDALTWLTRRLEEAFQAQGDEEEVPEALQGLQRETESPN